MWSKVWRRLQEKSGCNSSHLSGARVTLPSRTKDQELKQVQELLKPKRNKRTTTQIGFLFFCSSSVSYPCPYNNFCSSVRFRLVTLAPIIICVLLVQELLKPKRNKRTRTQIGARVTNQNGTSKKTSVGVTKTETEQKNKNYYRGKDN
jgi:hypothetical protein